MKKTITEYLQRRRLRRALRVFRIHGWRDKSAYGMTACAKS